MHINGLCHFLFPASATSPAVDISLETTLHDHLESWVVPLASHLPAASRQIPEIVGKFWGFGARFKNLLATHARREIIGEAAKRGECEGSLFVPTTWPDIQLPISDKLLFRRLYPITNLIGDKFWEVFWECFRCE
jgi:hypothetical protein